MNPQELALECEAEAAEFPDERVEALCEAADYWHLAGDDKRARTLYEQLVGEEGSVGWPQAAYAGFLAKLGERDRALALLEALWRGRSTDPMAYEQAGEVCEIELEQPGSALRWYTAGITRLVDPAMPIDPDMVHEDPNLMVLLSARARVRKTLGHPADDWDELAEASRLAFPAVDSDELPAEPDADAAFVELPRATPVISALYWPPEEFARYRAKWPAEYADLHDSDDPHAGHRRQVEEFLRGDDQGFPLAVGTGTVEEFATFREGPEPGRRARTAYAGHLARLGRSVPWPPGRNDPCWCGSGRKYKKCCGTPGFV
jgi:hypothetical protein